MEKQNSNDVLKRRIEMGERAKKVESNDDVKWLFDIIRNKKRQYEQLRDVPQRIGRIIPYFTGQVEKIGDNIQQKIEYFKITPEEDKEIIKEAQLRVHTFDQILNLTNNFIRDGEIARKQLEEIESKDKEKK